MAEEKKILEFLKPGAESPDLEAMAPEVAQWLGEEINVLDLMANMLKSEGVDHVFSLTSGWTWPTEAAVLRQGIQRIHCRHESTATFASEGEARLTGRPGVAMIGPGTGMTNSTSGVVQGLSAQSPTVIIAMSDPMWADNLVAPQGISRGYKLYNGISKYAIRVANPMVLPFEIKRAFRAAMTPPLGPVVVELPGEHLNQSYHRGARVRFLMQCEPTTWMMTRTERPVTAAPEDELDRAMKWFFAAERPAIITGEGIPYDDAIPELQEFVKLTGIPTHCRRTSRGAISEWDPLNCYGRARGGVMRRSDRAMVIGLKAQWLELMGLPPFWGPTTRYIQLQQCRENSSMQLATDFELIGNIKVILRQMIDWCEANGITKPPEKWNDFRAYVIERKNKYDSQAVEYTKAMVGKEPLHPDLLGRLLGEGLHEEINDEYITLTDSFTGSTYFSDWQKFPRAPLVLDASDTIGFGQSPGHALAAGMVTKRALPIVAIMGDGAVGAGWGDIETCSRWNIPVVFIHYNNYNVVTGSQYLYTGALSPTGIPMRDTWATLPNVRYDKGAAEFGCHSELVERDSEVRPALKRSLDFVRDKCRPAFIECFVDPDPLQEIWTTLLVQMSAGSIPWDELNPRMHELAEKTWEARLGGLVDPWTHPSWFEGVKKFREERGIKK
jgi:thiamine pyrophosphate-dependent acetolactate synthase large subunit-like protein